MTDQQTGAHSLLLVPLRRHETQAKQRTQPQHKRSDAVVWRLPPPHDVPVAELTDGVRDLVQLTPLARELPQQRSHFGVIPKVQNEASTLSACLPFHHAREVQSRRKQQRHAVDQAVLHALLPLEQGPDRGHPRVVSAGSVAILVRHLSTPPQPIPCPAAASTRVLLNRAPPRVDGPVPPAKALAPRPATAQRGRALLPSTPRSRRSRPLPATALVLRLVGAVCLRVGVFFG